MAQKIAFVTDSTAQLEMEQQERFNIHVVPLTLTLDGVSYQEGVDIGAQAFYEKLRISQSFPKTSQPAPGAFVDLFEKLLETHDVIVGLFVSEKLSGTINSARQAAQMVTGEIHIVDSGITSYGIEGPLLDGAKLAQQGGGVDDILRLWALELAHMNAYFVVDSLEFLHRGGRIGGAAAVFGSILQIKPILTIGDGKIELFEKIRTHKRALDRIVSLFDETLAAGGRWNVGVVHADRGEAAMELRDRLQQLHPAARYTINQLGPTVGSHTGPGVLAILFYQTPEQE